MVSTEPQKVIYKHPMLTMRGRIVELSRPWVMGIVNLTPDSFYSSSRVMNPVEVVKRVGRMLEEGSDIIDLGACSTRPGSQSISSDEEWERLEAPLDAVRKAFPDAFLSVDTFHADIAEKCISRWGVEIINDVSGGRDPRMFDAVAKTDAVYILMHTRGTPAEMDCLTDYGDVTVEVVKELAFRLDEARRRGVCNVVVDPGFGFAKTTRQNLELLGHLECLKVLECPVLVGMSRKRMVREAGECDASEALVSTVALNAIALTKGASILRVHDVREGVQTARTIGRLLDAMGTTDNPEV